MADLPQRIELFPGFVVNEGETVVDVGCGRGDTCVTAGKVGADVIAVEVDPRLIALLEQRMASVPARSFRGICSESNPLPLPDACADVVICTEVIEHIPAPSAFVAELVRIGKPGARYWLSVPDPSSESIMKLVAPPFYFEFPGHGNVFPREQFAGLIESAGLEIDRNVGVGFYHSLWWILRMASGTRHFPGSSIEPPALLTRWEEVWQELLACPAGGDVAAGLDRIMPKSQVVIAHKPVTAKVRVDAGQDVAQPRARAPLAALWHSNRR